MTDSKYPTPGPWRVYKNQPFTVCDQHGNPIVSTRRDLSALVHGSDKKKTAIFIASGPGMFEALESVEYRLKFLISHGIGGAIRSELDSMLATIDKAKRSAFDLP